MVSDVLGAPPFGPFFLLSQEEFDLVAKQYLSFSSDNNKLHFVNCSTTSKINARQDEYFANDTILCQFERLLRFLSYKNDVKGHEIEIIVDNARIHSEKEYSVSDFGKAIGTRCPVNATEYLDDHNQNASISCYFASRRHRVKSKGLFMLAKGLGVSVALSIRLAELCNLLKSSHFP